MSEVHSAFLCVEHILADMEGRDFDAAKTQAVEGRDYDLIQRLIVYSALRAVRDIRDSAVDMENALRGMFAEYRHE